VKLRSFSVLLVASLLSSTVHATGHKADVYFGYSRVGANLYSPNTSAMNGWQAAAHVKPLPFVGIEGDVSHYSQNADNFSQQVTLVMFGPRVTVHAAGFGLFAHGLGGLVDENAKVSTFSGVGYNAFSYAFGAGADLPVFLGLKVRVTGDYLGNSNAPSSNGVSVGSVSHYRFGAGVAYHF
jgi:hypothetical protein